MTTEQNEMTIRSNRQRNIVCVFKRGPKQTYYVGIDGPQLAVCIADNEQFEREFFHIPVKKVAGVDLEYTPIEFATGYMKAEARKMMPIAPSALRVLTAIIRGSQPADGDDAADDSSSTQLENIMTAAKDEGFRKPDGPVARVHKFLDTKFDKIRKGLMSRKECIDALVASGISEGTAVTQAGVWARNNGVSFARPAAAAEKKAAAKEAKKATPAAAAE